MKINARVRKIEEEMRAQVGIPKSERFVVIWPHDSEEAKELKIVKRLEELRQIYGDGVSREDIGFIRVVYDGPAETSKEDMLK
ncbi:MAG: hypothetical protein ACYC5X_12055 [Syntrophales bacterium]